MTTYAKTISRDAVEEALFQADAEEDAIYERYSGRAMYGAQCFGVTLNDQGQFSRFLLALAREGEDADHLATVLRTDSMGLSMIFYFPGVGLDRYEDGEEV